MSRQQRYPYRASTQSHTGMATKIFVSAAAATTLVCAAWAWGDAQQEESTRIKPFSDQAYSPERLKECAANDAKRAAQGKPAQLCWPDLVAH